MDSSPARRAQFRDRVAGGCGMRQPPQRAVLVRVLLPLLLSPYVAQAYTFLPMGNALSPQSQLRADAAFQVPLEVRAGFLSQLDELPVELVASQSRLLLVRAGDPGVLTQLAASNPGVRLSPLDAGPFGTVDEAAALLRRWVTESWECHKLEDGGNSCFEYGGCHRRCWWRGCAGRCVLRLECLEGEGVEEATLATCEPGSALAWLHDRVAADRDASAAEAGEGGKEGEGVVKLLVLRGLLLSLDAEHHYCGIALSSGTLGGTAR